MAESGRRGRGAGGAHVRPRGGRLLLYPAPTAAGRWSPGVLVVGESARSAAMDVPLT
ncbi:hypothetical protein [Streptomyces uncialis]|uniref:hypothetical protein n=1 Tax=Streptomyces uncialis TaxID=1048205 RepID=UPI00379177A2